MKTCLMSPEGQPAYNYDNIYNLPLLFELQMRMYDYYAIISVWNL